MAYHFGRRDRLAPEGDNTNPMRTLRTEIISVDVDRIVRHAIAKSEFTHIRTVPIAPGKTLLTVTAAADWDGRRCFWFRNRDAATKVLDRLVKGLDLNRCTDWRLARRRAHRKGVDRVEPIPYVATRTEAGVLIETASVDAVIEECLIWRCSDMVIVTGRELHEHEARIKQDIERSLVRWQTTGQMQALNQKYKALRLGRAPGEKIPNFKNWLTAQLEAAVLQPE
jgi:hypothetical protein